MSEKIGVFICECGPNIKDAIDISKVVNFTRGLEDVVFVKPFSILCSDKGKELIRKFIKEYKLTRVVIAGCSPKEHEATFRKILKESGLNPFLIQIANIREQCAWVIKDKALATQKAGALIAGSVKRVVFHEPLEVTEIECNPDVLVVGAGVAGISAALALAQKNRKIYLVERLPCIGGKVALYEEVFPNLECASCMLDPLFDEVLHHDHIELFPLSEVKEVLGWYGNFIIKILKKAGFVDMKTCIGCGECIEVCPVKVKNEYNEGLDERKAIYIPYPGALPHVAVIDKDHCLYFQKKECDACRKACPFGSIQYEETDKFQELRVGAIVLATGFDIFDSKKTAQYGYEKIENVYTSLEFERLLNSTGPTEGKILLKNGQPPKKIALIHCVGSRTKEYNEYCSGICCMYLLKFAHLISKKVSNVSIVEFYSDFCLPGKEAQKFFDKLAEEKGIKFLHMKNPDSITVGEKDGKILIKYLDIGDKVRQVTSDMVVLSPAVEGARDAQDTAKVFSILQDGDGFFIEEHATLAPVSTTTKGIFIAGCAQGPKNIQNSVAQGKAVAGTILSQLVPGEKLTLEATTAVINSDLCSGCKICIGLCPYKAVAYSDKEKNVTISEVLCKGCGVCVSACPSGAIESRHFTDKQIYAEIEGIIHE
jgi:heterodisulfide reductase subunit A